MSLAEGVSARVAVKFYADGEISANAPAVSATDLVATGGQILRRVSTSVKLGKDTYQSNEVRNDHQTADFRHGTKRVSGNISGELSPLTYADLFAAVFRSTWTAPVTITETDLTSIAADKTASTFMFGGGDPVAKGLRVGHVFRLTGASDVDDNATNYFITGFSNTSNRTVHVFPAPDTMSADTAFTLLTAGKSLIVPSTGFIKRKAAVEIYNEDIDLARLFTECRFGSFDVKLPASGMATVDFGLMGRNMEVYEDVAAPFFTSPAPETTTGILAAVNGLLIVNGEVQGVLTSLEIKMDLSPSADPVVGQNVVPEIFLGRANVTGSASAMLQDGVLVGNFVDEDEISILAFLTTTEAENSPGMAFYLPRIKFSDADVANSGEGGQSVTLPFQALKYGGTTPGVPQTTIQIIDTEVV
jgi:hypothetical protein